MKKAIAICTNISCFWENKIFDKEHCSKYFGASWMPIFSQLATHNGYQIFSGDIALLKVQRAEIKPQNIYVIQELNSRHGQKLLSLGAKGVILTGCESPLFSYYFYDHLKSFIQKFYLKKLFSGSYQLINQNLSATNTKLFFPSYSLYEQSYNNNWERRKEIVMIAANKSGLSSMPKKLKEAFIWSIHRLYKTFSPAFKYAQKSELHSKRLEMIYYFGPKKKLSLFGVNWEDSSRFKSAKKDKMVQIIKNLQPSFVCDKILTLSKYKYAICFENIAFHGYVTEKIIHCFLAGTIPIYLGAPDINEFVPQNSFIDLRNFNSLAELDSFLESLTPQHAYEYILAGKNFLESDDGKKFSYEYYAKEMLEKVIQFDAYHS